MDLMPTVSRNVFPEDLYISSVRPIPTEVLKTLKCGFRKGATGKNMS